MSAWDAPRRFLLVFMQRSGSTFLVHCLDAHIEIGAERGEPMHPEHSWLQVLPEALPAEMLRLTLARPGYRATVARANWRHALELGETDVASLDGVIYLHRENVVRNLLSSHINVAGVKAVHAYEPQPPAKIHIDVEDFLRGCERYVTKCGETRARWRATGLPMMVTTYEAITGGAVDATGVPEAEARRLCAFLGVDYQPLACSLRRINPEPAAGLVENWRELRAALAESEYRECLSSV